MSGQKASTHKVKQGECLNSIASQYGHIPDKIWQYSPNANLRKLRKNPDILSPGDVLEIPAIEIQKIASATDCKHTFCKLGKTYLHLQIVVDNESLAGEEYEICIEGRSETGTVGDDGKIDARIPPDASRGYITILGRRFEFGLGNLDPVDTVSGAQARLNQLGFPAGDVDNDHGEKTRESIKAFQSANDIEADGELNTATQDKIKQKYGA
jgi:N-acetylmuramoyl-L-alanine amidase